MKKFKASFIGEIGVTACLAIIAVMGAKNLEEDTAQILVKITVPIIAVLFLLIIKHIIDNNMHK